MKKVILPVVLLCTALWSHAQYFENLYGNNSNELLSDGHNAYEGGDIGHFLVGPSELFHYKFPTFCFNAERTDINGNATSGAPYFANQYYITEVGLPFPTLNDQLVIKDVKSDELTNSTARGFTLAGAYSVLNDSDPGSYNLFHVRLDPDGNVAYPTNTNNAARYRLNVLGEPKNAPWMEVVSVKESQNTPNAVFICGNLRYPGSSESRVFVLKVDETTGTGTYGNIIWARTYNLTNMPGASDFARDMIESPYGSEVLVVGKHVRPSGEGDAFFMRLRDGNLSTDGTILGNINFYGTPASEDGFTSIKASSNRRIGFLGENFVIGGSTNKDAGLPADQDFWLLSIDNATATEVWSNTFDYTDNTASAQAEYNECFDLIERINPNTGRYEYYLAGTTYISLTGEIERMVVKADELGRGFQQFLYPRFEAVSLAKIDQLNGYGPDVDGLSLFGSVSYSTITPATPWDHCLLKTYFNGITGCELHDIHFTSWRTSPSTLPASTGTSQPEFLKYQMLVDLFDPVGELSECFELSVSGGENLPHQEDNDGSTSGDYVSEFNQPLGLGKEASMTAVPNIIQQSTNELKVLITASMEQDAQISVFDINGRVVYTQSTQLVEGQNQSRIDLSTVHLVPGTYYIKLNGNSIKASTSFVVGD